MLWDGEQRKFVDGGASTTSPDDPCLQGLTIPPSEVIARINQAKGQGGRLDLAGIGLRRVPDEVWTLTKLTDLQLSNNRISSLPDAIGNLTSLERLGLAGNRLASLPDGIGGCESLEGLWAHGNLLGTLPDTIGRCERLRNLMLAGNRLRALPDSIGALDGLEELSVPGNELEAIPETVGGCVSLRSIDVHGNKIAAVPASVGKLRALEDFAAQGNALRGLPDEMCDMRRLRRLNVAENALESLPDRLGDAMMLTTLWCYANPRLRELPRSLAKNLSLKAVWAEGCGLDGDALGGLVSEMSAGGGPRKTPPATLGLDLERVTAAGLRVTAGADGDGPLRCSADFVTVSEMGTVSSWLVGGSEDRPRGYFKLARWRGEDGARAPVLIVAWGSAPGVPNWGGLLKKLRDDVRTRGRNNVGGAGRASAAAVAAAEAGFDVLYVSDVARSWYHGGADATGGDIAESRWRAAISEIAAPYARVLNLGDSMGASAALLYSDVADASLAFCPQVDLVSASIRPGRSARWMRRFERAVYAATERAVRERGAKVEIHSGTWEHDLSQAELVPAALGSESGSPGSGGSVRVVEHPVDNHRLALALEEGGELLPLVRGALMEQMAAAGVGPREDGVQSRGGGGGEAVDDLTRRRFNPGVRL